MSYSLPEIVARFGGDLLDDNGIRISGVASLANAKPGQIAFVSQDKYLRGLETSQAGAFILPPAGEALTKRPRIVSGNPQLYFARVSALLNPAPEAVPGVHPDASVHPQARVDATASIGAGAVVGKGAVIGARTLIGPNCVIGEQVEIGEDCLLHGNVTIYHQCIVGNRVILHAGSVIGSDGFGLANERGRWVKIPQTGRALIGDDVEVGACTTIDRGALDDTVIEEGVKLDNLIQVAHNVHIGAHTAIAACAGIAGSARIGKYCMIGGAAMIQGHIEIADRVRISTNTLITKSLNKPGTYTSAPPFLEHADWLRNSAHMRNLDKMATRIKQLEKRITELEDKHGNDNGHQ